MAFARDAQIRGMVRVLHGLWIAFLAATVAYFVIAAVIAGRRGDRFAPMADLRSVKPIFWIIGALGLGLALLLRRRLLLRAFGDRDAALIGVQAALVVGWAATEAVAILGLVLVLLGGQVLDAAPFFLASFVVVVWQRPTVGWLQKKMEEFAGGPTRIPH